MARYAYVNGRYVDHRDASVHIEDRGYQLADGVYEVVGVRDGKLIDEVPHIDRLDRSLRELRIAWPVSRPTLGFIMRELMRRNRLRDGLVYMQVTRGVARRDHAFPTTPVKPALVLTTKNTKHLGADPGPGVAVKTHPDIRWERCDIKTRGAVAERACQAGGARKRRLRGVADRRQGLHYRGRIDQRLDRHAPTTSSSHGRRTTASWPASHAAP